MVCLLVYLNGCCAINSAIQQYSAIRAIIGNKILNPNALIEIDAYNKLTVIAAL